MTTQSPTQDNSPRMSAALILCIWAVIYVRPLLVGADPSFDEDIWWHLRTGQWIVENRAVPATDVFSRHGLETGTPWVAYSWLFELTVYGFYSALGLSGILLFRIFLSLTVMAALHRFVVKREPRFFVAALDLALVAITFAPLISERPWLFTILFSVLTLDAILDLREGRSRRSIWYLPLLYVVWANLHIQFVYGLFLLGLACAAPVGDELIARWLKREPESDSPCRFGSRSWWSMVTVTLLCGLATLVNPYHFRLYETVLQYSGQKLPLNIVTEMMALDFRQTYDWVVLGMTGAAIYAFGRQKWPSCFDVLLLLVASWCAFRSRRDIWFVVLAATTVLLRPRSADEAVWTVRTARRQVWLAAASVVPLALGLWLYQTRSPELLEAQLVKAFPADAVAFVQQKGYRGPIYNSYNWGGYLIWQLREEPVSMDGRAQLHGEERLGQSLVTWRGGKDWKEDPDLTNARLVIAEAGSALASLLRVDKDQFEKVYEDSVATVFVARPQPSGYAGR